MNRLIKAGQFLYAIAILALGIEHFITSNFPVALLPISAGIPGRLVLVYATGTLFIIAGLCLLVQKKAGWATVGLGILFLLLDAVVHLLKLIANPYNGGEWTVFTELTALASGAFLIAGSFPDDFSSESRVSPICIRYGSLLLALSLVIFGIQHIQYADYVATLVPVWIPAHLFWAYFVGLAFIATAASILLKKQVRLSTTLLGIMFLLWVVILHAPRVVANVHKETEWTSLFIALAMGGISLYLAGLAPTSRLADQALWANKG